MPPPPIRSGSSDDEVPPAAGRGPPIRLLEGDEVRPAATGEKPKAVAFARRGSSGRALLKQLGASVRMGIAVQKAMSQRDAYLRAKELTRGLERTLQSPGQRRVSGAKAEWKAEPVATAGWPMAHQLFRVARLGDIDELKRLLESAECEPGDLRERDYNGRSLLLTCAREGHVEAAKLLLHHGCLLYTSPSPRDS